MGWCISKGRWTRCDDWGRVLPGAPTFAELPPLLPTVAFADKHDDDADLEARVDEARAALQGKPSADVQARIAEARKALFGQKGRP